ncbi:MAG: hypothetical protein KDB22_23840 [Planctomycetales bacterium]|nr:hypothetical protein [Planctomycetales bacterium]
MTSDASFYQFSKEVWQAVQDQAIETLGRREFCLETSRVNAMRCVHLVEEAECEFGRQVWFFEAVAVDPIGNGHRLYGALDFSVQFGLLEPMRTMLMDQPHHRQRYLQSVCGQSDNQVWRHPSTKIWVLLTVASAIILTALWGLSFFKWMAQ